MLSIANEVDPLSFRYVYFVYDTNYVFPTESTIFNQLTNEVMSNLNVLSSRMLNMIFKDVDGTSIVTIYSEMKVLFPSDF